MIMKRKFIALCLALPLILTSCAGRKAATMNQARDNTSKINISPSIRLSTEKTDAAEPAIAAGRDGEVYIAWVEHRGKDADVLLARINQEGHFQDAPVRVNPKAGEAIAWRGDPPTLAVANDGTIYVGWTTRVESTGGQSNDLYLSASRDGGLTFASPVKVNDDRKPAVHGMHSLAVAREGRIYFAWLDERNSTQAAKSGESGRHMESDREVFTSFSTDGGQTFSPNQGIATNVCPCCKTSLTIAPDGHVYASWRQVLPGDFRHIAVSSSTDDGKTFSPPVIVSDDRWMISGCPVSGAALNVGPDGGLRVLWYTAGEAGAPGLYWSESMDGAKTFVPRHQFANGQARGTPVLLSRGGSNLIAIWESNDGGHARTMIAQLADDGRVTNIPTVMSSSELPSAAVTKDQLFIAYISKVNDRREVWLMRAKSTN